jgi:tetratricopeptide (TPR) repeat protein
MNKAWWPKSACAALFLAGVASGCAFRGAAGAGKPSEAAARLAHEAAALAPIANEEDFLDAKFLYQALDDGSEEQSRLRLKMVEYLLGPLATLDAQRLRRDPSTLGSDDDFDRLYDSLHDALDLFPAALLWRQGGLAVSDRERSLLGSAARLIVGAYSPRGNELPVATGLFVLQTLEPRNPEWAARVEQVLAWLDTETQLSVGNPGPRTQPTTADILDGVATTWPSPAVVERVARVASDRQERLTRMLRRPPGTGVGGPGMLSELLVDSESISAMATKAAALYLRCGQMNRAAEAAARFADKPGDDPEFRQLLAAANRSAAQAADHLALARRFLPRGDLLLGTSTDRVDPPAAAEILRRGLILFPGDADMLVLASRVARFAPAPFLALRYLDEALVVLERQNAGADKIATLVAERMELAFLRLKSRIDPDRIQPALREAETLRKQLAQSQQRFDSKYVRLGEADVDLAVARGLVDSGRLDEAEPLLLRAQRESAGEYEVTLQIANLALKRGRPEQAAPLLRRALDSRQREAPAEETVPFVEGQARLAHALGVAYEVTGNRDDARKAWRFAVRGWERLMIEQLRRKSLGSSAGATFEVGRLYYLLGRREDGLRKFDEAIEQDESRDQSYIDAIAFLVQRGDAEPALDIYRRAISKSNRVVSEYVKVYASLWILDITRRRANAPDAAALAYLRTLDSRQVELRPPRASAWYRQLVRFALGRISYDQLLAVADAPGKRAEIFFYQAMRLLAEGKSNDAHALWSKVIDTQMASFFEYEMASRYLREGAPTQPATVENGETI